MLVTRLLNCRIAAMRCGTAASAARKIALSVIGSGIYHAALSIDLRDQRFDHLGCRCVVSSGGRRALILATPTGTTTCADRRGRADLGAS